MSDIYDPKFQNWIKGVLCIKETRTDLCEFATEKIKNEILSMSDIERRHLPMFMTCLNANNVKHLKTFEKVRRRAWKCEHTTCEILMNHMIELHASPLNTECKWTFDIDMQPRSRFSLEEDVIELTKEKEREVIWTMIQLFMYGEREKGDEKGKSLDDLDISKIVKMMRNCKLFRFDDCERLYENVIDVRNELMHSPDNQLSEEKVQDIIELLKDFLVHINKTGTACCTSGLKFFQHIEDKSFSITYQSEEVKDMARNVLKIKKAALDLDALIEESSDETKSKYTILKQNVEEATKHISEADFEDERLSFNLQPTDYKQLVKSTIEIKKEAIDTDIETCESNGETNTVLQTLKEETTQQLEIVNEIILKPDPEELVNSLSKQVKTLKAECNDYKTEIDNNYDVIDKLKTENEELKEMTHSDRQISERMESEFYSENSKQSEEGSNCDNDNPSQFSVIEEAHALEENDSNRINSPEFENNTFQHSDNDNSSQFSEIEEAHGLGENDFNRINSLGFEYINFQHLPSSVPVIRSSRAQNPNLRTPLSTSSKRIRSSKIQSRNISRKMLEKCNKIAISGKHSTCKSRLRKPSGRQNGRKPQRQSNRR